MITDTKFRQIPLFNQGDSQSSLPMASAEDVEFSAELADEDDLEAQQRAAEADRRAEAYEGADE